MSEAKRGYYSLIQFCPDPARAEVANLGVILFCPDLGFLDVRMAPNNDRVRQFFGEGSFDDWALSSGKQALCARLCADGEEFRTVADLERFAQTRANELILTSPRPVKVVDPERDLDTLYADLVQARQCHEKNPEHNAELENGTMGKEASSIAQT